MLIILCILAAVLIGLADAISSKLAHAGPGSLQKILEGAEPYHRQLVAWVGEDAWLRATAPFSDKRLALAFVAIAAVLFLIGYMRAQKGPRPLPPDEDAPGRPRSSEPIAGAELKAALDASRGAFMSVGLFSGIINVLALTGSLFMLEVYDRVIPSRSVPTLVGLAIITGVLFTFQGLLDVIRGRLMVRIGASVDEALSGRVYEALVCLPLKVNSKADGLQPLRDLDSIRTFLSGQGPSALFDLPWMPIYLAVIFSFHSYLGLTALIGALILIVLTLLTELYTRAPMRAATEFAMSRHGLAEASRRNAEVLTAMGMASRMASRWDEANRRYLRSHQRVSDVTTGLGGLSKILRLMLQSGVLGIGAYLVIHQEATAGIIIAGSILTARALAPVDLAIANWKNFVAARQSRQRLAKLLQIVGAQPVPLPLNAPKHHLSVHGVCAAPPGTSKIVLQDVSLTLKSGQGLGIIGPSASGKSSLVRLLVGVWQPVRGKVRLDGAALDQWSVDALGCHIGYLPQDVELFAGTVAQNISRFERDPEPAAVIAAAEAAGVHGLIVNLSEGYETAVGEQGAGLSAGQQQRIALARALYRNPFLVVLDEPNSNLDFEGERALVQAIMGVRSRGGIVILVAHREGVLAGVDTLLALQSGRVELLGPKDEILAKLRAPAAPVPLRTPSGLGAAKR